MHSYHDNVIRWEHIPRYLPFVREIHRSSVDSPLKGQWRGALLFYLICAWTNGLAKNRDAGDLRHHHALYDVTVMIVENVSMLISRGQKPGHLQTRYWQHILHHTNSSTSASNVFTLCYGAQGWQQICCDMTRRAQTHFEKVVLLSSGFVQYCRYTFMFYHECNMHRIGKNIWIKSQ